MYVRRAAVGRAGIARFLVPTDQQLHNFLVAVLARDVQGVQAVVGAADNVRTLRHHTHTRTFTRRGGAGNTRDI